VNGRPPHAGPTARDRHGGTGVKLGRGEEAGRQRNIPRAWAPEAALPRITCSVILSKVIASFRDKGTEDLFDGRDTKQARKACPSDLVRVARRKLDQLNQAAVLGDLRAPPSNRLEKLKGERGGQYSIRVNDQWRVCFRWADSGAEDVEIVDYH
jgi:toxin HigB-1